MTKSSAKFLPPNRTESAKISRTPNRTEISVTSYSLSIHQVLLVPLQIGPNLQIRAPPLKTAMSLLSPGIQSNDSFTTYLYSPES